MSPDRPAKPKTPKTSTKTARRAAPKRTARRAPAKATAGVIEVALAALGRRADEARVKLAELGDEGATAASQSLQRASSATRTQLGKLEKTWKGLDAPKKAAVVTGVLAAIAAAAAPLVRRKK
jgi:hypothetical protein